MNRPVVLENFSSEFFHEIFDYRDGCDIFQTFSDLNHRFEQLLDSSSLLFKINVRHSKSKETILHYKHKILSMHLTRITNEIHFNFSCDIDSSFIRLESLMLASIEPGILFGLLSELIDLPRLLELTLDIDYGLDNLTYIYEMSFQLRKLKYLKVSDMECVHFSPPVSLPMASKSDITSLEYLDVNHSCTLNDLSAMMSYTPQLQRLKIYHVEVNDSTEEMILPISLPNLTHLYIYANYFTFDELEIFIKSMHCRLEVLRLITRPENTAYLDAARWERFILLHLPQLERFYLDYYQDVKDQDRCRRNLEEQFTSSFWLARQWIFGVFIDHKDIVYFVHPYKNRWHHHGRAHTKSTELILSIPLESDDSLDSFIYSIDRGLPITRIYHLEIDTIIVASDVLIEIMNYLPELQSLKIWTLLLVDSEDFSSDEYTFTIFDSVKKDSQITKVYLKELNENEEIDFLMDLCPHLEYFQIDSLNEMDIHSFLPIILDKIACGINQSFRALRCRVPGVDDQMVEDLEAMIKGDNRLINYKIKRLAEHIDLQWN